jgi:hypothetical protein
MPHPLSPF